MLQTGTKGSVCHFHHNSGANQMNRPSNTLLTIAFLVSIFLGLGGTAEAQRQRSEREVRDAVRTLNSQIDDLKYDLEFEARNNGGDSVLADASANLEDLKDRVAAFDENVSERQRKPRRHQRDS